MTSLTLPIATSLEATLALVVRACRQRGRQMSNLARRHQRMLRLSRRTLDFPLDILEPLVPHLQIPAPEQEVTATRNPSVVDTRR